jgi:glycosyltransferase involved in cell wall biosynthesis
MRILFFSDHFYPEPSAPAAHVYERCLIWSAQGHDVTVLTNAPNFPLGEVYDGYTNALRYVETMGGVRVVRVKTYMAENKGSFRRIIDYMSYTLSSFIQVWREECPDVVISTSPHLFAPIGGALYAKLRRIPHVMEVRDLWPASIAAVAGLSQTGKVYRFLEWIELWLYKTSQRIIVVTDAYRRDIMERGVPGEKIELVRNGANLQLFANCQKDEALATSLGLTGRFVVGYLGTIGGAHALITVLDAAERLRDDNVTFLMVGVGAEKDELEREAHRRGLGNVTFVGRKPKEQMPDYWGLCDVGLIHLKNSPIFETVIPTKIFEALAVGVPIIYGVPKGEGSAIVEDTNAGLVIEPENPEALAEAVQHLRNDPTLCAQMRTNAKAAAPRFSRKTQAEKTLTVLESALGEPRL